ncbi:MAG: DUF2281 domain-containing protein [Rhodocyclaceae bacterium]|nr:DUF2281 domain-containing protein [Rhodocyclaceae bacterium]
MTLAEAIYQRSLSLPDAAAQEALDFIEFLGQRYGTAAGITAPTDAWFKPKYNALSTTLVRQSKMIK